MDNGFVVYENIISTSFKYRGVGEKNAWPLWLKKDELSVHLTNVAEKNWFDYQNVMIQTIPDLDFVSKYVAQCHRIHIPTSVFYLSNGKPHFQDDVLFLGYDCLGTENYSYLYEDDGFLLFRKELSYYRIHPNKNGLFYSYSDCEKYKEIRTNAIIHGMNLEDAWPCTTVCVERITARGLPEIIK